MNGLHGAAQRVVPSLPRHRIGIERRHESSKNRGKHLFARREVRVERHRGHAQLGAEHLNYGVKWLGFRRGSGGVFH